MSSVSNSNSNQTFYLFPPKEELEALLNSKVKEANPSFTVETIDKICKIAANIFGAKALSESLWDYKTKSDEDLIDELKVQCITDQREIDDFVGCFFDLIKSHLGEIGKDYAIKNPEKLEAQKEEALLEQGQFNKCASKSKAFIEKKEDQKLKQCLKNMYCLWEDHGRKFVTEHFDQIANNGLIESLREILRNQTIDKDIICASLIRGIKDLTTYRLLIEVLDSPRITKLFYSTLGSTNPVNLEEVIASPLFSWDNIDCKEFVDRLGMHTKSTNRGWTDLTAQILLYDWKFISFLEKLETKKEFEDFIKTIVHPYLEEGHDSEMYGWLKKIDTISPYFSRRLANQLFSSAVDYPLNIPETLALATPSASSDSVITFLCKLVEKANHSETTPAKRKDLEMLGKLIISKLPQLSLIRFAADSLKGTNLDNDALVKWVLESEEKKHLDGLIKTIEFWEVCLKKEISDLNRYLTLIRYFPVSNSKLVEFYELSKKHKNIPAIKAIFMNLDSEETKIWLVNDFIQWFPENIFAPSDFEEIAPYFFGSQMISLIDTDLLCNFLQKLDPKISEDLLPQISIEHIQNEKVLKVILDLACDVADQYHTKKIFYDGLYISKATAEKIIMRWRNKNRIELTDDFNKLKDIFYEEFRDSCIHARNINFLKTYADKALDKESFFELSEEHLKEIIRNANPEVFNILIQSCMKHGKINVVKAILDANSADQSRRAAASHFAIRYGRNEYMLSDRFDFKLALSKGLKLSIEELRNAIEVTRQNNLLSETERRELALYAFENISLNACLAFCDGGFEYLVLNIPNEKLNKKIKELTYESELLTCFKHEFLFSPIEKNVIIQKLKIARNPDLKHVLVRAYLDSYSTLNNLVTGITEDSRDPSLFDKEILSEELKNYLMKYTFHENSINQVIAYCLSRIMAYNDINGQYLLKVILSSKKIQKSLSTKTGNLLSEEVRKKHRTRDEWLGIDRFVEICVESCPIHICRCLHFPPSLRPDLFPEDVELIQDPYHDEVIDSEEETDEFSSFPLPTPLEELPQFRRPRNQVGNNRDATSRSSSRTPNSNLSFSRPSAAIQTNSGRGVPAALPQSSRQRSQQNMGHVNIPKGTLDSIKRGLGK